MALIKDNTHGKFAKIVQQIKSNHAEHKTSFENCLDTLDSFCRENNSCECTLTSCFLKNEMDFSITDKSNTRGRICFDRETGFHIFSNNQEITTTTL